MANYANLKTAVQSVIRTNANNEITGAILQSTLLSIINSLASGYIYGGVASESTNPGTPDQNIFYIAGGGTYPNFGSVSVPDGSVGIFRYNGSWTLETFSADSIIVRVRAAGASNSACGVGRNILVGIGWNGTTFALENGGPDRDCLVFAVNGSRVYLSNFAGAITYFRAYDDTGAYIGQLSQQYLDMDGTRYFYADLPSGTAFIIANKFPSRDVKILQGGQFNLLLKDNLLQRELDAISANDYIDLSGYSIDNNIILQNDGTLLPGYTTKQAVFFHANAQKTFFINRNLNGYPIIVYDKDYNYITNFVVSSAINTEVATGIWQITYTTDGAYYLGFNYEKDNGVKRSVLLYNWFYMQNLLAILDSNAQISDLQASVLALREEIQAMKKAAQVGDLTMAAIVPMMYDFHGIISPTAVRQMPVVSATNNAITLSASDAAIVNQNMQLIVQLGSGNNATFVTCFFGAASNNVITKRSFENVNLSTATFVMSVWDTPQGQNGMHLSCLGYKAYAHSVVSLLNRGSQIDTNLVKTIDMTTSALAKAWNNPDVYDVDGNLLVSPVVSGLSFGGYAFSRTARNLVVSNNVLNYNGNNGWRGQAFYCVQNDAGYIEFPFGNINSFGFLAIEAGAFSGAIVDSEGTTNVAGSPTINVYNNDVLVYTATIDAGTTRRFIVDNLQAGNVRVRFTFAAVPTICSIYSLRFYNLFSETPLPSLEEKQIAVLGDSWTQYPQTNDATVTPGDAFNVVVTRPDGTTGDGFGYFPKELERITGASVDNWGKSGETTEWALTQIDKILSHKVYDILIIEFGLNDRSTGITIEQWKENLITIANKAKLRGVRPIILAPTVTNSDSQSLQMGEWFEKLINGLL